MNFRDMILIELDKKFGKDKPLTEVLNHERESNKTLCRQLYLLAKIKSFKEGEKFKVITQKEVKTFQCIKIKKLS